MLCTTQLPWVFVQIYWLFRTLRMLCYTGYAVAIKIIGTQIGLF